MQKIDAYKKYVESIEKQISSFLEYAIDGSRLKENSDKNLPFYGIPFGVKDNIAVKDFKLTCGSNILKDFVSPYTATAVKRLEEQGAVPVGKTNLDEFGMGSSTDNSALLKSNNPWKLNSVCGGSSGGSAASVAAGLVPFALGSDTGGSVRQPASFCGCYGLKPTYGAVSRFGLVAYASSLEVVGILGQDIETTKAVFNTIAFEDELDQTSFGIIENAPSDDAAVIGIIKQVAGLSPQIEQSYNETIEELKSKGYKVVVIDIPALEYVVPAYYTIATAEASANLARFTGIRYGFRADDIDTQEKMVAATRNQGFGDEVKLRILLGTYVLRSGFQDQYYIRAQKIRTAIRQGFDRAFNECDLILSPVFPTQAFIRGEGELSAFAQKMADNFTASANLAGIPSMAIPTGVKDGLPVGMQLMGPEFSEERIFKVARKLSHMAKDVVPPILDSSWRK
ncbi:MAG: Asp-tRNA(Asn)/Glu-tRNA(Gln) amidotransferase subunit GatA [Deltaproteobacteria bacterium]|nr:Asp-tRNA(Asn)/Glu-tRNA(Gln) amidotransferase subunit GatA [Deltaproteobacteria bacterium]